MSPLRVLHVAQGAALAQELGGYLSLLLRALRRRGVDALLLTSTDAPGDFADGVPTFHAATLLEAARAIRQHRPRLVHLHSPFAMGEGAALFAGAPIVVSQHDSSPGHCAGGWITWVVRLRAHRAVVGPYGVDVAWLEAPDELGVAALRQAYAAPLALCVSPLHEGRGVDTLLEAWARLAEGTLLLIGSGPHEAALRRKARSLGLTDRVAFHTPPTHFLMPNFYHAADLYVEPAPSTRPPGLSLLAAQACGVPAIRTALQARDEEGALVVAAGDLTQLIEALRWLVADAPLRLRLGAEGRLRVRRDFTEERMADAVLAMYREVMPGVI